MEKNPKTKQLTLGGKEIPTLTKDQIDCRVGQAGESWFTLLLYKDARVDMSILDELVGPENWQRDHKEIKGNLYCGVGIRVNGEWAWKWDCGVESNTEKEKGEASDSFKRACVNWGIGRELYTAPRIILDAKPQDKNKNGKLYPDIRVAEIQYNENREVSYLRLVDKKGVVRYSFKNGAVFSPEEDPAVIPAEQRKAEHKPLKKGQLITRAMVDDGACDSMVARLHAFVGKPEYQGKAAELCDYYKWDTLDTFNEVCRKAFKA